ncbi:MAG: DNA polymerase IV [Actinomycetota bacterium]|nr:DNA polymerase IV [Actinomycetota bacterium]
MTHPPFTEPILHVDMDAFFVEVERRRDPRLVGRPVVVAGLGARGVVAAASYEARRFGVQSATPTVHARRLCPHAVFLPAEHHRYREASTEVFEVLRSFTPLVEGLSLDEAFLDVSGLRLRFPDGAAVGAALRLRIGEELALPASVGVASNKFLAKLASQLAKPDGLLTVPAGDELAFLHPLPVHSLWGVGEATHGALEQLGVHTVGDLAAVPPETLGRRLGQAAGRFLHELAWARDARPVIPEQAPKSVSVEQTYEGDLSGEEAVERELLAHCQHLSGRLRRSGMAAGRLALKVRYADFTSVTRSAVLPGPTDVARDLFTAARMLVERVCVTRPIRLLGLAASGLVEAWAPRQLAMDRRTEWDDLAAAVDRVRLRFGSQAIGPARLATPPPEGS